ncbi:MAG: DUF4215 domain-containing protein [Myxococcota bacterium]
MATTAAAAGCFGEDGPNAVPSSTVGGPSDASMSGEPDSGSTTDVDSISATLPASSRTTSGTTEREDDSTTTGACTSEGCPCDPDARPSACDEGLYCDVDTCALVVCGDGRAQGDEQCDDGNDESGDGCDNDCTFTEIQIDVSYRTTCALIEGGRVRCWGNNDNGEAGYGNTEDIGDDEFPYEVGDVQLPLPVIQLQSGDEHVCGRLDSRSHVLCWGRGADGVLGYGNPNNLGDDEFLGDLTPVNVGAAVSFVTTGGTHTCVTTSAGQVKCWGSVTYGQLGYGGQPNEDVGDDEVPAVVGNVQVGAAIVDLSGGIGQTCVITSNGAVKCWGLGASGQLGYGNALDVGTDETPADVEALAFPEDARAISAGFDHTCALFEGGIVRCWGAAYRGQLGSGSTEPFGDVEPATSGSPLELPLDGEVVAIAAGDDHNCALDDTGALVCWGDNMNGQLGIGSTETIGDDEPASASMPVVFDRPIRQFDAGGAHTCAVLDDYRVYCWGWNGDGQLGLGHKDPVGDDELPSDVAAVNVLGPSR